MGESAMNNPSFIFPQESEYAYVSPWLFRVDLANMMVILNQHRKAVEIAKPVLTAQLDEPDEFAVVLAAIVLSSTRSSRECQQAYKALSLWKDKPSVTVEPSGNKIPIRFYTRVSNFVDTVFDVARKGKKELAAFIRSRVVL